MLWRPKHVEWLCSKKMSAYCWIKLDLFTNIVNCIFMYRNFLGSDISKFDFISHQTWRTCHSRRLEYRFWCYRWTCSVQTATEQCSVSSPAQIALLFRKHFRCKEICLEHQWIVCLVISTNETRKTNKQVGCCIHMVILRSYTWDRTQFPAACLLYVTHVIRHFCRKDLRSKVA